MPRQVRCDVISLFDLNFVGERLTSFDLAKLEGAARDTELEKALEESRQWIFDDPVLLDFRRYCLTADGTPGLRCSSLLLNEELGVGVFFVWTQFDGAVDPLEVKLSACQRARSALNLLERILPRRQDHDRHFPLVSIVLADTENSECFGMPAESVGRLLSGGLAHERSDVLSTMAQRNVSQREYERLFLTWNDAVALYRDGADDSLYEGSLLRAVQLFETCIAIRRMLLSIDERIDALLPTVTWWRPRPLATNRLIELTRTIERKCVNGIPFASVEGQALGEAGYREFGLSEMVASTMRSCEALERRHNWAKGQLLACIAVATYLFDKLKLFDFLPWGKK